MKNIYTLLDLSLRDHLKTQEMCEKAIEKKTYQLGDFLDHFKTKRMCEKAGEDEPEALEYVSPRDM